MEGKEGEKEREHTVVGRKLFFIFIISYVIIFKAFHLKKN